MARRLSSTLLVAVTTLLVSAVPTEGQQRPFAGPGLEIAAQGGGMFFDVDGFEPHAGGRLAFHLPNGIGFGASVDWASRGQEFDGATDDADTWLYAGEVIYTIPSASRANFFVFLGYGEARFEPGALAEAAGADTVTETLIPIGLGLLWYNHPGRPWWAIRAEVRDNIILADDPAALGREDDDDEVTNNYGIAVGLSLLLGSHRPTGP